MPGIKYLNGIIKHYDWGGYTLIPSLLNLDNKERKPFAEYWMSKPSLPFLLKVLDVREMLSIQVHPSKAAAEKEFERENKEGIPLDASNRNYKDPNHKPELMVALSDFWLLHGFKPPEDMIYTLLNVVELRDLLAIFKQSGYEGLYRHVMEMPQEEVNRILRPLVDDVKNIFSEGKQEGVDEDYWAFKAAKNYANGDIDRGIFSIYLFNLVHLKKGEGIFQAAGVPHAYLEGQNVEIMANSDNVLRGGLTTKHIDVKELMKHVKCEPTYPKILEGEYTVPVNDFKLFSSYLKKDKVHEFTATDETILLITEGAVELVSGNDKLILKHGSPAALIEKGVTGKVKGISDALVFRAN
jgi:mannose-6-phosphate isomerase